LPLHALHSFPTRRSSDLHRTTGVDGAHEEAIMARRKIRIIDRMQLRRLTPLALCAFKLVLKAQRLARRKTDPEVFNLNLILIRSDRKSTRLKLQSRGHLV